MDEIICALYDKKINFNATQYKIILCILDNTEMLRKIGIELSVNDLSRSIRMCKKQAQTELRKLIKLNIVKVVEEYSCEDRFGRVLSINDPSLWIEGVD